MKKLKTEELNRLSVDQFKDAEKNPLIIVLDNIRSLNNIGSIFRTADAFRVEGIYLCGITARPPHREIHKTALGATDSVYWEYWEKCKDAVQKLVEEEYRIVALEQTNQSLNLLDFKPEKAKKYALIFGNEVNGISDDVINEVHECIEIPQFGTKHSFNVTVSAGIVIWDILTKLECL
jgi:tRNA G18 (ribose-2'-O)-methylase SpoU